MPRPKLLFVSPRFLFPTDEGGKIRSANILRHLKGGRFEIILASPAPRDHGRFAAAIAATCDQFVPWRERSTRRILRLSAPFSTLPFSAATSWSRPGYAAVRRTL